MDVTSDDSDDMDIKQRKEVHMKDMRSFEKDLLDYKQVLYDEVDQNKKTTNAMRSKYKSRNNRSCSGIVVHNLYILALHICN